MRLKRLRPLILFTVAAALAAGQSPRVGAIEIYGNRTVNADVIRKAVGIAEGGALPSSRGDLEDRLEAIPGVAESRVQAACCDEHGDAILYVGIRETIAPEPRRHDEPSGDVVLPDDVIPAYVKFLQAVADAGKAGNTAEDLTRGHSLMADAKVRAIQEKFIAIAAKNTEAIRKVLRECASEEQRAIAAYVIQYAPDKKQVLPDLQYALEDPDETVRNNAMRGLGAFAVYAHLHPDSGLVVPASGFIELLNSVDWRDRHTSSVNLVTLTDRRNDEILSQLRAKALFPLIQMARWKQLEHALPSYILLGRIQGIPEKKLEEIWSSNNREEVIRQMEAKLNTPAESVKPGAKER